MFRILESQAPAKQNAPDTINTLSGRLQSATLLEDRRAAILGLRSFARIYPASVASGALRNLINSLNHDGDDVDTTKVVLETLLMLFNPEESSPEASDDIALWLADEFTQRQENITILLDLLDRYDFFSRLYSLQLISAIASARAERTEECVYTAPLGVSRLVGILDDKREAVRAEALLLLTALTATSPDLQKLVAFENAFDRVFSIIKLEGSLTHGGVVVQDCLSLLANLLRLNISNQSYFRETGGVSHIAVLVKEIVRQQEFPHEIVDWTTSLRNKNVWGLLSVIRLFLFGGGIGTQLNQLSFWHNGVVFQILDIAFHPTMESSIRAEALSTCADLIRGNGTIQEQFAQREVMLHEEILSNPAMSMTNGHTPRKTAFPVNIIQGLLDLALSISCQQPLNVRLAACECIKAYLFGHAAIRLHFLRRAMDGHRSADYESDNILTVLLEEPSKRRTSDPYRQWIAAVLLFHLLFEDYETKRLGMEITEGDAARGEEVVTCIQTLSGNLITKSQRGEDEKVCVGYLMVLCGWLFEHPDAVNDFLGEASNIERLIEMVMQPSLEKKILVTGLGAFLLGIVYEFSTKDSPISRTTIHGILISRLGREQLSDRMTKLREHYLIRDFEVLPHLTNQEGGIQDIYFDKTFVDFLKDNYSRVIRAIDRDPGIEISVVANGVQKGISRELVDSLKSQVEDRNQALQKAESDILSLKHKLGQEQADHRKTKEFATSEVGKLRNANENMQKSHEEVLKQFQDSSRMALKRIEELNVGKLAILRLESNTAKLEMEAMAATELTRTVAEVNELQGIIRSLEDDLQKSSRDHAQDLRMAHEEYDTNKKAFQVQAHHEHKKIEDAEARANRAQLLAEQRMTARDLIQTELDDLFMVLADLEEKRARDKKQLKALGELVSDEDEDEDEKGGNG